MIKIYEWLNKEKNRFYKITIQRNAHEIILDHHWGSCFTNRGGKKNLLTSSEEEAQKIINKMIKRRKNRGYELIL